MHFSLPRLARGPPSRHPSPKRWRGPEGGTRGVVEKGNYQLSSRQFQDFATSRFCCCENRFSCGGGRTALRDTRGLGTVTVDIFLVLEMLRSECLPPTKLTRLQAHCDFTRARSRSLAKLHRALQRRHDELAEDVHTRARQVPPPRGQELGFVPLFTISSSSPSVPPTSEESVRSRKLCCAKSMPKRLKPLQMECSRAP